MKPVNVGQSLAAAADAASVDRLNSDFYGRIKYPGPVYSLMRVTPDRFFCRMLAQDIGRWGDELLPEQPRIWVAGCGRNQALITALKFPHAKVLGSDLS